MKLPSMAVLLLFVLIYISSTMLTSITGYQDTRMITNNTSSWNFHTDDEVYDMFSSWLVKHEKTYNSLVEKEKRFEIFKDNLMYIEQHNSNKQSYKLGLNKFADLPVDEYRLLYTRPKKTDSRRKLNSNTSDRYFVRSGDVLPNYVDWRTEGAIGPVKDQGNCGCCWAFSSIGSVEAINQIITGDLIKLSEQDLVDCDTSFNEGCNGGDMSYAFKFIVENGGIDSDQHYPYTGNDGACHNTKKNSKVVSIDGHENVFPNNESALQKAVANQPVSVSIAAGSRDFQHYASGIFNGSCGIYLDHAVVLVGYGTEDENDYWIVRNSWSEEWGEQGYMRLERNTEEKQGRCGIAMEASFPIKNGLNPSKSATLSSFPNSFLFGIYLVICLAFLFV